MRAIYFSSGYMASFSGIPSSSRMGSSSWRYSSYWPLFSTLNLIPDNRVSKCVLILVLRREIRDGLHPLHSNHPEILPLR